jgi:hypothetical protein
MRTFRLRRASEIISAASRGDCTAVFRRFEEKTKMLSHREGAKNAKQTKKKCSFNF